MDKRTSLLGRKFISGYHWHLTITAAQNILGRSYSNQTHKRTRRVMEFYSSVPIAKFGEEIHAGDYTEETSNWTKHGTTTYTDEVRMFRQCKTTRHHKLRHELN
jgi:hypothetical protein